MSTESKLCCICYPKDRQTKIILKCLYRKFTRVQVKIQSPFAKTLNNVLKIKQIKYNDVSKCREHVFVKKKFMDWLKIREDELNKKAQYILMLEIRRNYTLDLLGNQVKETPGRVIQIVSGEESEPYKAMMLEEKERKIKKKRQQRQLRTNQSIPSGIMQQESKKPSGSYEKQQVQNNKKQGKTPWYRKSVQQLIRIQEQGQNYEWGEFKNVC